MGMIERRAHRRYPFVTKVTFIRGGGFHYYYSTDLSLGGIFVETKTKIAQGAPVELEFRLPDDGRRVRAMGRIARRAPAEAEHNGTRGGLGIQFTELLGDSRKILLEYLGGEAGEDPCGNGK